MHASKPCLPGKGEKEEKRGRESFLRFTWLRNTMADPHDAMPVRMVMASGDSLFGVRFLRGEQYYANSCVFAMKYVTPEERGKESGVS